MLAWQSFLARWLLKLCLVGLMLRLFLFLDLGGFITVGEARWHPHGRHRWCGSSDEGCLLFDGVSYVAQWVFWLLVNSVTNLVIFLAALPRNVWFALYAVIITSWALAFTEFWKRENAALVCAIWLPTCANRCDPGDCLAFG